jgi:preprotein translocase subunit SecG
MEHVMESLLLVAGILRGFYCFLLFLTGLFLILLVLIQRGRGGGLAGAFGGMGGQSAFGTKAGDTFTKITIVVATFWIVLCILGVKYGVNVDSVLAADDTPVISEPSGEQEQPPLDASDLDTSGEVIKDASGTTEPSGSDSAAAPSSPPDNGSFSPKDAPPAERTPEAPGTTPEQPPAP